MERRHGTELRKIPRRALLRLSGWIESAEHRRSDLASRLVRNSLLHTIGRDAGPAPRLLRRANFLRDQRFPDHHATAARDGAIGQDFVKRFLRSASAAHLAAVLCGARDLRGERAVFRARHGAGCELSTLPSKLCDVHIYLVHFGELPRWDVQPGMDALDGGTVLLFLADRAAVFASASCTGAKSSSRNRRPRHLSPPAPVIPLRTRKKNQATGRSAASRD
jgi:hypothetical protein